MTRKIAKSAQFSVIVALLVLMVIGLEEVFADSQTLLDLHEFDQLLDGVGAAILSVQDEIMPQADTSDTIHTEFIEQQRSYLEAFDEVVRTQFF